MCRRRGTEASCTYDTVIRRRGPGKKSMRGDIGKNKRALPMTRSLPIRREPLTPSLGTPNPPSTSFQPIAPAPIRAPSVEGDRKDIPSSEGSDYKELVRKEVGLDIVPAHEDSQISGIPNLSDSTMAILTSVSEDEQRVPLEEPLTEQNAAFPPSDKSTCLCSDDLEFLSTIPPTTGNVTPEERRWHDFSDDCVLPEAPKSEGVTCELSLPSTFLSELLSNSSAGWDYFGDITNLYERSRADLEGIAPMMNLDEGMHLSIWIRPH
ncbi:hypothetical protein CPB86DRAFT_788498 [Serendipita vermifera]|nr:hypothetical protein CPB86DRAFT_788498 [Serendipita vermifera]